MSKRLFMRLLVVIAIFIIGMYLSASSVNQKSETVVCPRCIGEGSVFCPRCGGSGIEANFTIQTDIFSPFSDYIVCTVCGGTGRVVCPECNGYGRIVASRKRDVS